MPHSQSRAHQDGLRGVDQQTAKLLLATLFPPIGRGAMWVAEKHDQAQPPLYPALSFIHISGSGVSGAKLFSCTIFRMVYLD